MPPTIFKRFTSYVTAHKIITIVVALVIIAGGTYIYKRATSTAGVTQYVLAEVTRNTIVASVTGTGQISASNQVDLKPKASGDITRVYVQSGQNITAGTAIVQIDPTDALKAVRDAKSALTSAQIALTKTQTSSSQSTDQANSSLTTSYQDANNNISATFTDMATALSEVKSVLLDSSHSPYMADEAVRSGVGNSALVKKEEVVALYYKAEDSYTTILKDYAAAPHSQTGAAVDSLLTETAGTSQAVADLLKQTRSLTTAVENGLSVIPSALINDQTALDSNTSKINSDAASLLGAQNSIANAKDAVTNAEQSLAGSSEPLDVQSAQLTLEERQNAVTDAEQQLADDTIRAPFSGTLASLTAKQGDSASAGSAVATLVTTDKVAEISLNEVDIAKIKLGQKATLTFDAIDGLTISGHVAEIDTLGTVSQGVVTYDIKIALDTQDDRILPGMSVGAAIITDIKSDVLTVPASAVKSQNDTNYVEVFNPPLTASSTGSVSSATPPVPQEVVIGISDDNSTEIVSGLTEGEQIVSRTITSSATTPTTSQAPSLFGNTRAAGGGAGGAARFGR